MDRRNFLMSSAAALTASQAVFGTPSDTVRIAVIGVGGHGGHLGGRGKNHLDSFGRLDNVESRPIDRQRFAALFTKRREEDSRWA